ncbi:hypothetical protein P8452_14470 [Trifolium repens]|nr:hypothetical protein P8452_14470 [Trifolium repens]
MTVTHINFPSLLHALHSSKSWFPKEDQRNAVNLHNALTFCNERKSSLTYCKPRKTTKFSFPEIEKATDNFNPSLVIGEGGYGHTLKGLCCLYIKITLLMHINRHHRPIK